MAKGQSPQEIAAKQVRRAQAAVQDYKAGVEAVTQSPTEKAAKAVDLWFQGLQKSYQDGSYVDGLNAVSLADWKSATIDKGAMNYAPGIMKAQQTIEDFQAQRQAAQSRISSQLESMPRGDLNQNIQRMVFQATQMSQFKFRKRRRS